MRMNFTWMKDCFNSVLLRGQLISILIAGTGIFATLLSSTNSNYPTLMSLLNYVLLSTYLLRDSCIKIFLSKFNINSSNLKSDVMESASSHNFIPDVDEIDKIKTIAISSTNNSDKRLRKPLYWYFFSAVLDLEANFLVISAYNYTSITSIMLLDCFTIPCTMCLSHFFLSYRYTYKHIIGVVICIFGLVCIVVTDATKNDYSSNTPENALIGDILCLLGSFLYASSNVLQEHIVKFHNREEYLGILGGFGMVLSFIQFMILDFGKVKSGRFTYEVILYIVGFVGCLFCMYANTSMFLISSDSTLFNLSLLTSDVYAVIFSYFLSNSLVHWAYFVSFGLVISGLFIYHNELDPVDLGNKSDLNENIQENPIRFSLANTVESPSNSMNLSAGDSFWKEVDDTDDGDDVNINQNV